MYYMANVTDADVLANYSTFAKFVTSGISYVADAVGENLDALGITKPGEHRVLVFWGVEHNRPEFRIIYVTIPEPEVIITQGEPIIEHARGIGGRD